MSLRQAGLWIRSHRAFWADLIRIYLGIGLLIKGVYFLLNSDALLKYADTLPASVVSIVPYIHIVGGLFLALGIVTRIAAILQIPVVAGALVAVNLPRMTGMATREAFEFSALTLFLLVLIAIWGGGPLALERKVARLHSAPLAQGWLGAHSDLFMDLIRAYLGIGLFVKGIYILQHQNEFQKLIENTSAMPFALLAAAHYVIPA